MCKQILEEAIKYRWGALPEQQRQGIRNYISNLIIKISSNDATFRSEKVFLNKLNIILVQVNSSLHSIVRKGLQRAGFLEASYHIPVPSLHVLTLYPLALISPSLLGAIHCVLIEEDLQLISHDLKAYTLPRKRDLCSVCSRL